MNQRRNKQFAILGEFSPSFPPHLATDAAILHSCAASGLSVEPHWVSTESIDESLFGRFSGIWVAPGSPYKNLDKTLLAIRLAREQGVPCLGTCGGFQHIVLEYARNVLGFADAQHAEYDPYASRLFISRLACSLVGREMELDFAPDSLVAKIYGAMHAREHYYCNFGVASEAVALLKRGALRVVGSDAEGEVRVVELPEHPFFVGTLFVPQTLSRPDKPHPLVTAFLRAVSNCKLEPIKLEDNQIS